MGKTDNKDNEPFIEIITEEDEIIIESEDTNSYANQQTGTGLEVDWKEIEKNVFPGSHEMHAHRHSRTSGHSSSHHHGSHSKNGASSSHGSHSKDGTHSSHSSHSKDGGHVDRIKNIGSNKSHQSNVHQKKHKRHKKKWSRRKKILMGILFTILGLIATAALTFFILRCIGRSSLTDYDNLNLNLPDYVDYEDGGNVIYYKGHKYGFNRNLATFLFMGIDNTHLKKNATMGTAGQADALYLFTYDVSTYRMRVLCLNRDTMCDISRYDQDGNYYDTKTTQLCLAYAFGDGTKSSATNQITAVERLIYNIPINAYYAIDLSAIKILNDDVGGVTVVPEYTFNKFTQGVAVTLHGDDAEAFVRTRDVTQIDDNLRRMSCQRVYINSFANSLIPATKSNFFTPINLYNDSKEFTVTNVDAAKLAFLATDLAFNYNGLDMIKTKGKYRMAKNDASAQFKLNEKKFFETILDLFYTKID